LHAYQTLLNGKRKNRAGTYAIEATATDNAGSGTTTRYTFTTKNVRPTVSNRIKVSCLALDCDFLQGGGLRPELFLKDSDGLITGTRWRLFDSVGLPVVGCDGEENTLQTSCEFFTEGTYTIQFEATDNSGLVGYARKKFRVKNSAPVIRKINWTCVNETCGFTVGAGKPLDQAIYDRDGTIVNFVWEFLAADKVTSLGTLGNSQSVQMIFPEAGIYYVRLTAKDNYGKMTSVLKKVRVKIK